ncbi:D-glycero-beta-D-manno-heptose 1,7-bisphosphate 7-phosphatase [Fusobacterium varium]|uniref:D-glycero-beta-D-manno-heptose 1,7-bisphosphate 7-phosphatase n=1 Tax=Fusobacterium varium TaxID=856 RepID=UPI000BBAC0FF|nr:D-glycero-beta-D-manno-heptose 1,7-bisphosphate 7-phosphatase [uncultured Fusobacterium sp.]BBA53153.1 D-glycero-alpha-D-manno-heptose-1,7-bisphosphate 7-phosphatase [Fusobacterium varium]
MKKAILLDRDGTINVEKDYLHKVEDFEFEKNVVEALKIFSSLGYTMAVVTNQSGIARGYYTEDDLKKLNEYIKKELEKHGVIIEKFYYCPHHPENGIGKYKIDCICRKPNTGMLDEAIKEFNIDRTSSFMVGDTIADIDAGSRAGLTPVLVKTGHGMETLQKIGDRKIDIFDSLYDFALSLK